MIENPRAQPVPSRDPLAPFVISPCIAGEMIKEWDGIDLEQIDEPKSKRRDENTDEPETNWVVF